METKQGWRATVLWATLLVSTLLGVGYRSVCWSLDHPFPVNWDEAHYLTFAYRDRTVFEEAGFKRLLVNFVYEDLGRPPAYRVFVAPMDLVSGVDLVRIRLLGFTALLITAAVVAATVYRQTRSAPAAMVAAMLPLLSPLVVQRSIWFGTEATLYLATALCVFFLLFDWDNSKPSWIGWIGLGVALAAGGLSKTTFATIGGGMILLTGALSLARVIRGPGLIYLLKACVLGGAIALPWWSHNWRQAIEYANYAMAWQRNSLGAFSLAVAAHYLLNIIRFVTGFFPAIVIFAAIMVAALRGRRILSEQSTQTPKWWPIYLVLGVTLTVIVALQLRTSNHEPRLVTPILMLLSVAAGIALAQTNWLQRLAPGCVVAALFVAELLVIAAPPPVQFAKNLPVAGTGNVWPFKRMENWDYLPLYALCEQRGYARPSVAIMGNSFTFNIDQARVAWAKHQQEIHQEQLWRWEWKDFSMETTIDKARKHDIVLTAPNLVGEMNEGQHLDNQYNQAFAAQLAADPQFGPPQRLIMGRSQPTEVLVFFNKAGNIASAH